MEFSNLKPAEIGNAPAREPFGAGRAALRTLGKAPEVAEISEDVAQDNRPGAQDGLGYQTDWASAMLATGGPDVLACICEDVTRGDLLGSLSDGCLRLSRRLKVTG